MNKDNLEKSNAEIIEKVNSMSIFHRGVNRDLFPDEKMKEAISLANARCLRVIANAKKELKYYSIPALILDDITEKISGFQHE